MNKSKEAVFEMISDMASKIYTTCLDYITDIDNTNMTLVDYDINGAIDYMLISSKVEDDESLRDGLYSILEDISSLEFEMYSKEDYSIFHGVYDVLMYLLVKKLKEDGFKIYNKREDTDYFFDYYICEVTLKGEYTLDYDDTLLCSFIITIPYDFVILKMT